ncbi:MAG: hypothetical protein EON59_08460 [Alphaproteobacteria bacterium]|nr:MAG: hypothetical protein EON59_08460 [Alphaproteobacteria bacterium]
MAGFSQIDWQLAATVVSALGTMLATVVLVAVTWVLAKETKRLADATAAPHVVATLDPSPWSIIHTNLVLHNSGTGPAYDVEARFDPPLNNERGEVALMPLRGLSLLKPNESFSLFLKGFEKLDEKVFQVNVSWLRSPGAKTREAVAYTLDLRRDYQDWGQLGGSPPEIQMSRDLKKIRESIERLASGFNRLNVDVHDAADRMKEEQELERAWRDPRSDGQA